MTRLIKTGYMKVSIEISEQGPLTEDLYKKARTEILESMRRLGLNVEGQISFIQIDTLELEGNKNNES